MCSRDTAPTRDEAATVVKMVASATAIMAQLERRLAVLHAAGLDAGRVGDRQRVRVCEIGEHESCDLEDALRLGRCRVMVPPRVEHLVDAGAVLVHGGAQGGGAEHASVRAGVVAHEQGDAPGIAARELASRRLVVDGGVAAVCRPTNVRVERGVLIEGGLGQGAESGVGANANRVKREVGGGDRARQRPFAARPGRGSPLVELTGGGPPPPLGQLP